MIGRTNSGAKPEQSKTVTPNAAGLTVTPDAGKALSSVIVNGDADLASANIKAGVSIFGVAGNANVVDTSAGDAVAADILSGKNAYVDGALVTGTIASKGAQTYTPGVSNQTIAAGQYLSGTQTIAGDADLIAANIKSGVDIFGVSGAYVMPSALTVQTFLSSGTWVCPSGVYRVWVWLVGGGAGGGVGSAYGGGYGGGGGYCKLVPVSVTPGTSYPVIVGAGGAVATNGGASSFGGVSVIGGISASSPSGTGGGGGALTNAGSGKSGGNGSTGSDGASGTSSYGRGSYPHNGICPFDSSIICGGGGGSGGYTSGGSSDTRSGGTGGDGGGGDGGKVGKSASPITGTNGTNGLGGGGGGNGANPEQYVVQASGAGGSGRVMIAY